MRRAFHLPYFMLLSGMRHVTWLDRFHANSEVLGMRESIFSDGSQHRRHLETHSLNPDFDTIGPRLGGLPEGSGGYRLPA